jgi:hypothetical protein
MTRTAKGALACARLDQRALEKGALTSIPVADARYDRVVDWNGRLYRVQVKYTDCKAPNSADAVQVNLRSTGHRGVSRNGYGPDEVDAIVVYIPSVDAPCWFDVAELAGKPAITIRLAPSRNGQQKGVRYYGEFLW